MRYSIPSEPQARVRRRREPLQEVRQSASFPSVKVVCILNEKVGKKLIIKVLMLGSVAFNTHHLMRACHYLKMPVNVDRKHALFYSYAGNSSFYQKLFFNECRKDFQSFHQALISLPKLHLGPPQINTGQIFSRQHSFGEMLSSNGSFLQKRGKMPARLALSSNMWYPRQNDPWKKHTLLLNFKLTPSR